MPSAGEVLILLAAVFGSGTMVAVGGWFVVRLRRLEAAAERNAELAAQVDALREQLAGASDELGELAERVDFAERLLTSGDPPKPRP